MPWISRPDQPLGDRTRHLFGRIESTQAFTIAVTDINDQGAVGPISDVDGAAGGNRGAENAAINDLVGITAQATDPDPGDSVSYHQIRPAGISDR